MTVPFLDLLKPCIFQQQFCWLVFLSKAPWFSVKWYLKRSFIWYSSDKKSNQNIRSQKRKTNIWETILILAGTIVLRGVEKMLILKEELQKVLEILRKVWDNWEKTAQGTIKFVRQRLKFQIPIFEIPRVFCFDQVLNDQGTG